MPKTTTVAVQDLVIDLKNFRTVEQSDEMQAIQAMISIGSDEFWALTESLADDGYFPTENIIVLESDTDPKYLLVKEGNRRIAALKIIHGYLPMTGLSVPEGITNKISRISQNWKHENKQVTCAVYPPNKAAIVDKIVTLIHGKSEKAGRHNWNAVARARHNREHNKVPENALDLLEKYLLHGENLSKLQTKLWAGEYNLSVLDEAIGKIASRFGTKNGPELVKLYPSISNRSALDDVMRDIGVGIFTFSILRQKDDCLAAYLTASPPTSTISLPVQENPASQPPVNGHSNISATQPLNTHGAIPAGGQTTPRVPAPASASAAVTPASAGTKILAIAIGDPRQVKRTLKKFKPLGNNREKVVALRDEATKLTLDKNPIAFCFLLRSMFEISAKAYCDDHKASGGPALKKTNGDDKSLSVLLGNITEHLTKNNSDKAMVKALHGAMTELGRTDGLLSVTSMNQLVHNPTFSIAPRDIATLFSNIYPLLGAMNS